MRMPRHLVALSVIVNNATGGPKDYSLCARFYGWHLRGRKRGDWAVWLTDGLFFFDSEHCRKAWMLRRGLR